jgi:hypothetical protein
MNIYSKWIIRINPLMYKTENSKNINYKYYLIKKLNSKGFFVSAKKELFIAI